MKWMIASLLFCALFVSASTADSQVTRVGTFQRQSVVLAYYRSPQWNELLHQKRTELDAAKQANDREKVAELDKWFGDAQELAHTQLWGNSPIDNVVIAIAPATQEICKAESLSKVVSAPAPDAQSIDVTEQILQWLKADEKTREFIRQMQQK